MVSIFGAASSFACLHTVGSLPEPIGGCCSDLLAGG